MELRTLFGCFFLGVLCATSGTYVPENAQRIISPSLLECYEKWYLAGREAGPPHTLSVLLAILRKVENARGAPTSLRSMSLALLHRFRQDGIIENPKIASSDGVTPYAPIGFQFHRHARTLRLVPGNALLFPNDSISAMERCTLHTMLSSSIAIFRRADEGTACKFPRGSSPYYLRRRIRDAGREATKSLADVETLTSEEIASMERKGKNKENADAENESSDPNSVYPELPANHPNNARLSQQLTRSECPLEDGVIKTPWADVAGGPLLAGIAAGLEPQTVRLGDLFREEDNQQFSDGSDYSAYASSVDVDNRWFATLAGDLAEATLLQGPSGGALSVGANGTWNSTINPKWYFLHSNANLSMTTAEIRGDLDGLILAQHVRDLHTKVPNIRLSQILEMYYSARGLLNGKIRACDRRKLLTSVAPNDTMSAQAFAAALLLKEDLARATLNSNAIERFAVEAAGRLAAYVPSSMNNDPDCSDSGDPEETSDYSVGNSVNLTVILDTSWSFTAVHRLLSVLLEQLDVNPFASSFAIIDGFDGKPIVNSSHSILDFYAYNETHYANVSRNFDLPRALDALATTRTKKLEEERERKVAGGNADVVLILPYRTSIPASDREYCVERLKQLRERSPDTRVLVLTQGSKDVWSSFVEDASKDVFSIGAGDIGDVSDIGATWAPARVVRQMANRIRKVPKRLVNTQCGADYVGQGSSNSFVDYVRTSFTNSYRIHPNYFFSTDYSDIPTIKIQPASGWGATLRVCSSRDFSALSSNSSDGGASCATVKEKAESVAVSCADASYIHECPPLYLSVTAIDATDGDVIYRCTDPSACRFPDSIKYTISYENLRCASSASTIVINFALLFLAILYFATR